MANAYSILKTYQEYIPTHDITLTGQVFGILEQRNLENRAKLEAQIENFYNLNLLRDVDKKYVNERLDALLDEIDRAGHQDLGRMDIARNIGNHISQLVDDNVLTAISSTNNAMRYFESERLVQEKSPEKFTALNTSFSRESLNKWLQSGKVGDAYHGGTYVPYTDIHKRYKEFFDDMWKNSEYEIELPVLDANGNRTGETVKKKVKGLTADEINSVFISSLTPNERQQLQINAWGVRKNLAYEEAGKMNISNIDDPRVKQAVAKRLDIESAKYFDAKIEDLNVNITALKNQGRNAEAKKLEKIKENIRTTQNSLRGNAEQTSYYLEQQQSQEAFTELYKQKEVVLKYGKDEFYWAKKDNELAWFKAMNKAKGDNEENGTGSMETPFDMGYRFQYGGNTQLEEEQSNKLIFDMQHHKLNTEIDDEIDKREEEFSNYYLNVSKNTPEGQDVVLTDKRQKDWQIIREEANRILPTLDPNLSDEQRLKIATRMAIRGAYEDNKISRTNEMNDLVKKIIDKDGYNKKYAEYDQKLKTNFDKSLNTYYLGLKSKIKEEGIEKIKKRIRREFNLSEDLTDEQLKGFVLAHQLAKSNSQFLSEEEQKQVKYAVDYVNKKTGLDLFSFELGRNDIVGGKREVKIKSNNHFYFNNGDLTKWFEYDLDDGDNFKSLEIKGIFKQTDNEIFSGGMNVGSITISSSTDLVKGEFKNTVASQNMHNIFNRVKQDNESNILYASNLDTKEKREEALKDTKDANASSKVPTTVRFVAKPSGEIYTQFSFKNGITYEFSNTDQIIKMFYEETGGKLDIDVSRLGKNGRVVNTDASYTGSLGYPNGVNKNDILNNNEVVLSPNNNIKIGNNTMAFDVIGSDYKMATKLAQENPNFFSNARGVELFKVLLAEESNNIGGESGLGNEFDKLKFVVSKDATNNRIIFNLKNDDGSNLIPNITQDYTANDTSINSDYEKIRNAMLLDPSVNKFLLLNAILKRPVEESIEILSNIYKELKNNKES